jgi:hypothetical protein
MRIAPQAVEIAAEIFLLDILGEPRYGPAVAPICQVGQRLREYPCGDPIVCNALGDKLGYRMLAASLQPWGLLGNSPIKSEFSHNPIGKNL